MTTTTVARLLADSLEAHDVDQIFCVPGESYVGLTSVLTERNSIRMIVCRHEGGAGFMAVADGRLRNRAGVCIVSRGPGLSNAMVSLHSAFHDATPLVMLVGQVERKDFGRLALQEQNYSKLLSDITKSVIEVNEPEQASEAIARAFHVAESGTPGPVAVILPEDIFDETTDASCVDNAGRTNVNLTQVTDGSFYGVNGSYGPDGGGSIYKLTSAKVFTDFLFPNPPPVDGDLPLSTLLQNTNGKLYGTTPSGGPTACSPCQGTFFSVATGDAAFINLEPTQRAGFIGASVGIFGQGFSSSSVVKFGGVKSTSVTLSGSTYLTAKVPVGALTAAVTVTTGSTTLTSPQTFKVKPKIASFSPTSGPVGTLVTINGSGLTQTAAVKFGTVEATTFTVVSDSKVTADVPTGATGSVTISITSPGGTANSATKFTVN